MNKKRNKIIFGLNLFSILAVITIVFNVLYYLSNIFLGEKTTFIILISLFVLLFIYVVNLNYESIEVVL